MLNFDSRCRNFATIFRKCTNLNHGDLQNSYKFCKNFLKFPKPNKLFIISFASLPRRGPGELARPVSQQRLRRHDERRRGREAADLWAGSSG